MKKPMRGKKFLSLCLALVLVLALLPVEAFALSGGGGHCGDGLSWTLENGALTISGSGTMYSYSASTAPWYKQRSMVKSVLFASNNVTGIGDYAFYDCTNLVYVDLPSNLTSIGSHAFSGCSQLSQLRIRNGSEHGLPTSIRSIGSYAFEDCSSLTGLSIPNGVTAISEGMLSGCSDITSIGIPSGVTSIGKNAFQGCRNLESIEIPSVVTSIGSGAFQNCARLDPINGVVIPAGVTALNDYTFYGCSTLKKVTLSVGMTAIGNYAFYGCSSISQLTIPNGVETIGNSAFDGCASLNDLSLPIGVTQIGADAFANCTSLKTMTIPEGMTEIPANVFYNDSALETINLPASLTKIGFAAFSGCAKLIKVSYAGNREDWKNIQIQDGNTALTSVSFHAGDDPPPATIPVMVSATAVPGKVTVIWEGVNGATNYVVKRRQKKSDGTWTAWQDLAMTTELQYIDTSVTGGTVYKYSARANTSSEFDTVGLKATAIAVIPMAINSVSADKTGARPGDAITWTVSAQGNLDTLVYLFHVYKAGTDTKIAQSNNGTYTEKASFSYTPADEGTYSVKVFVRYKDSSTQILNATGGSVTVSKTAPVDPLSLTGVKADKTGAKTSETITWTAAASGGSGTLQYYFILYKDGKKIKTQAYSTNNTFSYAPKGAGTFKVKAYVKDAADTKVNKTSDGVTVTSAGPTISSVKAGITSAYAGEKITWTAAASGGSGTLKYYFILYKDGTKIKTRSYSTANTFSYTPTEAGSYKVKVYVKDSTGAKSYKTSGKIAVTLGPPVIISVKAGKTSSGVGEKITWTAAAVGSEQPLQYLFFLSKDGKKIKTRSYSTTNTFSYTPTEAGIYRVKVYVKDATGEKVYKTGARITVS